MNEESFVFLGGAGSSLEFLIKVRESLGYERICGNRMKNILILYRKKNITFKIGRKLVRTRMGNFARRKERRSIIEKCIKFDKNKNEEDREIYVQFFMIRSGLLDYRFSLYDISSLIRACLLCLS